MPIPDPAPTLVKNAIHNPAEPRHFMRITRPTHTISATAAGIEVASSARTLKVKEVGHDIYDPVIYFPRADVAMKYLARNDKTTHCPLKGDTEYFDIVTGAGRIDNAAWSYDRTLAIAHELQGYIGFDTRRVQIIEYTVAS
jgi:uncharacterized protein (DUF427 family)